MQKILIIILLALNVSFISAQTDTPQPDIVQPNPFSQFEEMIKQFGMFDQHGGGVFMDTMIIQQFGGSDIGEMDQSMEELMQMMQAQLQGMDFGNMPGFEQLLEGFEFEALPYNDGQSKPNDSDANPTRPKKEESKRRSYKL